MSTRVRFPRGISAPSLARCATCVLLILVGLGPSLMAAEPKVQGFSSQEQGQLPADIASRRWTELRSSRHDPRGGTRLFLVVPPAEQASTGQVGQAFPDLTRWAELTEQDGAILVLPDPGPDQRWDANDLPYLEALYRHCSGYRIEGASRYLAAYGDAGKAASLFALKHTSLIAGAAFVAPVFPDLKDAARSELPLAVLLIQASGVSSQPLLAYFQKANGIQESLSLGPEDVIHRRTGSAPWNRDFASSHFVRVTTHPSPSAPDFIYKNLFRAVARWKTLAGEGTLRARVRAGSLPGFQNLEEKDSPVQQASVYIPTTLEARKRNPRVPLVVLLHGVTCTGEYFLDQTEWYRVAEEHGFLVYAPSAPGFRWQPDGVSLGRFAQHLRKLASDGLEVSGKRYPIDASRIYLSGFSNGSFFSSKLILQYPELFAAAALWAGVYRPSEVHPKADKPLPVWYGIGLKDPYYPDWKEDGEAFVAHMGRLVETVQAHKRVESHAIFGRDGALTTQIHPGTRGEIRYSEAPLLEHGCINEWPGLVWKAFFSRYRKVGGRSVPRAKRSTP